MAHLLKGEPKVAKPTLVQTRALIEDLHERQCRRAAREDAQIAARGKTPLPRTLPLRDGREEVGRMECFIPKNRYWRLRQKYGRQLFTSDSGIKDLRKHHPEWFTETVNPTPTFGLSDRGRRNYAEIFGHD